MGDRPLHEWLYDDKGIPVARLNPVRMVYETLRRSWTPYYGTDGFGKKFRINVPLRPAEDGLY